jgi:hypothetical protein
MQLELGLVLFNNFKGRGINIIGLNLYQTLLIHVKFIHNDYEQGR